MENKNAENFSLLRWRLNGHSAITNKLKCILNKNEITQIIQGERPVYLNFAVEQRLGLPSGWLERDNVSLLDITASDYELVIRLIKSSQSIKDALLSLMIAVGEEN